MYTCIYIHINMYVYVCMYTFYYVYNDIVYMLHVYLDFVNFVNSVNISIS